MRVRKVILATNVAETSLTVEGVTDVIDSGQHKVLRYDAARGLDRLELERIPADSAEQRAGTGGADGAGPRAAALGRARSPAAPARAGDRARGPRGARCSRCSRGAGTSRAFEWFEAPPPEARRRGDGLLERLGAVSGGRLTPEGEAMHRLPLHPRLARVLLLGRRRRASGRRRAPSWARAGGRRPRRRADDRLRRALGGRPLRDAPPGVRASARELRELAVGRSQEPLGAGRRRSEPPRSLGRRELGMTGQGTSGCCRALLAGFPDRVARRREPGSSRLVLSSGAGALLGRESGVREASCSSRSR